MAPNGPLEVCVRPFAHLWPSMLSVASLWLCARACTQLSICHVTKCRLFSTSRAAASATTVRPVLGLEVGTFVGISNVGGTPGGLEPPVPPKFSPGHPLADGAHGKPMPVGSTCCFFCPSAYMTFFGLTWSIHDKGCWKGDGPRPPGVRTGVPSHRVELPSFIAAMAFSKFLAIMTWRSSDTLQMTWLYLHPGHFPKRPKLVQLPLPPTCTSLN